MRKASGWLVSVGFVIGWAACVSVSNEKPSVDGPGVDGPAPPPMFLSCEGLAPTCGPTGNGNCCESLAVPGGTYYRSYDAAGDGQSGTQGAPATVSNFRLDAYEVTVGRFRAFVMAGKGTQASPPASGAGAHLNIVGSGWDPSWNASLATDQTALIAAVKCNPTYQTWTDAPGGNEVRPMSCISWYEAMAFCAWDGGYLPTEAEWNYAAAGGSEQRAYPWSSPPGSTTLSSAHASYYDGTNCVGDGMPGCAVTDLWRVGSRGAGNGRWGQSDLTGNVWEWNLDWYDAVYAVSCTNCAQLAPASFRVRRGGSFANGATDLRAGLRNNVTPGDRYNSIGVRCARSAP